MEMLLLRAGHLRGRVSRGGVIHRSREFESAHQHRAVAAYRVGGLGAETTRLEAVGARNFECPLGERIHSAARVAERTENPVGALYDHGEIRSCFTQRLALAYTGDAE